MKLRNSVRLTLAAAAIVVVGCGPIDSTGPTAITTEQSTVTPSADLFSFGNPVDKVLRRVRCVLPDPVSALVGPLGGTIRLGRNTLEIPRGSLRSLTRILMLPVLNGDAGVIFYPEGLQFSRQRPPTLTLDTRCVGSPRHAYIVYTDDFGHVLQRLNTVSRTRHSVSAHLEHFSRYAVAW